MLRGESRGLQNTKIRNGWFEKNTRVDEQILLVPVSAARKKSKSKSGQHVRGKKSINGRAEKRREVSHGCQRRIIERQEKRRKPDKETKEGGEEMYKPFRNKESNDPKNHKGHEGRNEKRVKN